MGRNKEDGKNKMSKWRNDFLDQFGSVPVKDLQIATKIKQAEYDLADILAKNIQKTRNEKTKRELNKILDGRY